MFLLAAVLCVPAPRDAYETCQGFCVHRAAKGSSGTAGPERGVGGASQGLAPPGVPVTLSMAGNVGEPTECTSFSGFWSHPSCRNLISFVSEFAAGRSKCFLSKSVLVMVDVLHHGPVEQPEMVHHTMFAISGI